MKENFNKYKIEITRVTSWKDVLNSARFTQRKELLDKEPSTEFKKKIIKSEHSPLRCLMFHIDIYNIPRYVSDHLVRHHEWCQPFVSTGRSDVLDYLPPREEQRMTDLYNTKLFLNAQEIINISKVRLCNKTEKETKEIWQTVIDELRKIEPELANACVPNCYYRGFCPEFKSCGWAESKLFPERRTYYINNL